MTDVLLFDLGGVLVDYTGVEGLQRLLPTPMDQATIRERLVASSLLHDFETGAIEPLAFADAFITEWGLALPPAVFLAEFRSWSRSLFPGAKELLDALRPSFRLAVLSNSNAVHWDRNTADLGIPALFEVAFSSHQLGLHKPNPAIYREVLARLRVAPEHVAFFDDMESNVAAARDAGMSAFCVRGIEQLTRCLREQGWLARP